MKRVCLAVLATILFACAHAETPAVVPVATPAPEKSCPDMLMDLKKSAEDRGLQFAGQTADGGQVLIWLWVDKSTQTIEGHMFFPSEMPQEEDNNPAVQDLGLCSIPQSPKKMHAYKVTAPIPEGGGADHRGPI